MTTGGKIRKAGRLPGARTQEPEVLARSRRPDERRKRRDLRVGAKRASKGIGRKSRV